MERVKGRTVLIGKEPGQGRLLVAVAGGKAAAIGAAGCVPNSVSRCKAAEGIAHAKITIDADGNMTLTNMKPQNCTFVNGSEIVSKRITTNTTVELGKDRFRISIPVIIETARKIAGVYAKPKFTPEMEFNIKHLEAIYNDYHSDVLARQKKQKKLGLLSNCSMFFTIGGGAMAVLANKLGLSGLQELINILPVLGFIVFVISMYMRIKDNSIEEADKANMEYTRRFVCPNHKCGKFLGNMPYELMKIQYNMQCPYCKSKFVEK